MLFVAATFVLAAALVSIAAWNWSRYASQSSARFSSDLTSLAGPNPADASQFLSDLAGPQAQSAVPHGTRVVYKYSVVPGGVQSADDLRHATRHDYVVAQHYAGFDYDRAKVVELSDAKLVYLSYRLHDKIYWTKKKVALRKGEKLITDGKMAARSRCGNRVSESAQPATSPEEPPAEKFEEPVADGGNATQIPFPGSFESALLSRPAINGFGPDGPPNGLGGLSAPLGPGSVPGIGPPPLPPGPPNPPPPPPPPPPVPEPGTIVLVTSGIAGIYLRYRKSSNKS